MTAAVRIAARSAEYREIVRLGGTGGEHDLRRFGAYEGCDLRARPGDARRGGTAVGVRRGGIAEVTLGGEALRHGLGDRAVHGRRSRVVEIKSYRIHRAAPPAVRRRFCTAVRIPRRMLTSF